jgi:hypothetical protein
MRNIFDNRFSLLTGRAQRNLILFLAILFISLLPFPVHAQSEEAIDTHVSLVAPDQEYMNIGKKPVIQARIDVPFSPENLYVILDDYDVSDLIEITDVGFQFRPFYVLLSGPHTLTVYVFTDDGQEIQQDFTFWTQHYDKVEEAYSSNEVTAVYEGVIKKSDEVGDVVPNNRIEANLSSDNKIRNKGWEFGFTTNLRYLEQDLPVIFPDEKGISLANYLFHAAYSGEAWQFLTEVGDVQVNETQFTVSGLARRGGKTSLYYKDFGVNAFVVKSEQLFGFKGGTGIGDSEEDHIFGGSFDAGLFSNTLRFKTIYVTGGEEGSSFGIATVGGNREGDVLGFLLTADPFDQKFQLEGEVDFSDFDADSSDAFPSETDHAYKIRTFGFTGNYAYEAFYEYRGPDYEVIGNLGLQKDREGITVLTSASYPIHVFNLSLSRYNDNVEEDPLFAQITDYQGMIDYSFNKFPSLPIGATYEKSVQESSKEPASTLPLKIDTDRVSGRINYVSGSWNLGFQASHSMIDDRTDTANDSTVTTYMVTPAYFAEHFSITPNFAFNTTHFDLTGTTTDTFTTNLDLRGDIFERILFEFAGTFNRIKSSDDFIDLDTISAIARVDYILGSNIMGFLNPSVGVRGRYNETNDRALDERTDEYAVLFIVSNTSPISF